MNLKFPLTYILLVAAQILLANYLNLSQYVVLCFLPAMILILPIKVSTIAALCIAFATGMVTDFFTTGILGLCTVGLVPVALCRNWIIQLVFGSELFSRQEDINIPRQGMPKVILATLIATGLYFLIFTWVDGAGTRPLNFNLIRFGASLAVSTAVSIYIIHILTSEEVRRWR